MRSMCDIDILVRPNQLKTATKVMISKLGYKKEDIVESELRSRVDNVRTQLGGDEGVEEYFKKPLHKLRQEWREAITNQTLTQQMQQEIAKKVQDLTPYDVQKYVESVDEADLPMVPMKYQLSQICIYPDREAANRAQPFHRHGLPRSQANLSARADGNAAVRSYLSGGAKRNLPRGAGKIAQNSAKRLWSIERHNKTISPPADSAN